MPDKLVFVVDQREKRSSVVNDLLSLNSKDIEIVITFEQLKVGDYQLSDDVVVERKTIEDLEASIIDGRIFSQIEALSNVPKSCLIIENPLFEIYEGYGRINRNALIGLLTKIGLDYKLPIFFTRNSKETADFLFVIAKREQLIHSTPIKTRYSKTPMSYSQRQLFIMESFPNIGPTLARSILKEFKTLKNVANADVKDLQKVKKLGRKKAEQIKYLLERNFGD
ncbi:MAG TPA: ERCC4 domain-containing protein [archaeon]|nr:ERCC4 domain-containing protein [archaeon]HPC10024.1 ERCC4 domain-containing protein [archaeon]HRT02372.1 ERCC4 domain-containing protein [Candidatus Diapherotrites archaeon]